MTAGQAGQATTLLVIAFVLVVALVEQGRAWWRRRKLAREPIAPPRSDDRWAEHGGRWIGPDDECYGAVEAGPAHAWRPLTDAELDEIHQALALAWWPHAPPRLRCADGSGHFEYLHGRWVYRADDQPHQQQDAPTVREDNERA